MYPKFRVLTEQDVMPLIYNSLECEHMPVQEKVLKLVPHLCEILDYGTVQNVLLVNVAVSFPSWSSIILCVPGLTR